MKTKIEKVLDAHKKWLRNKNKGVKADFSGKDMRHCVMSGAYLDQADFHKAVLRCIDFSYVQLRDADFSSAKLLNCNFKAADLTGADFTDANFFESNLAGACLDKIQTDERTAFFFPLCPAEGSFTAYKKAADKIVVLEIPADAKRTSATTYKFRADKAKVLRIENLDGTPTTVGSVPSDRDPNFYYTVGGIVVAENFEEDRRVECVEGVHFFISREMAAIY